MMKANAREIREMVFCRRVDGDPRALQQCQVMARRTEAGRPQYLCRPKGLSLLHGFWASGETLLASAPQTMREFNQHGQQEHTERWMAPLRLIDCDVKKALPGYVRAYIDANVAPGEEERVLLSRLAIPEQRVVQLNQERLDEEQRQGKLAEITDVGRLVVCVLWGSRVATLEPALCVPGLVDLLLSAGKPGRRDSSSPAQDPMAACLTKCEADFRIPVSMANAFGSFLASKEQLAWVDHRTLSCVQNERRRRQFLVYFVLCAMQKNKKVVLVTKAAQEAETELEGRGARVLSLALENVLNDSIFRDSFDVAIAPPQRFETGIALTADLIIYDAPWRVKGPESFEKLVGKRLLVTYYSGQTAQETEMARFLGGGEQDQKETIARTELGMLCAATDPTEEILCAAHLAPGAVASQNGGQHTDAVVLMAKQTAEEKLRQRLFLDSSMALQRLLGEEKRGAALPIPSAPGQKGAGKQSIQGYLQASYQLLAQLLRATWASGLDPDEADDKGTQRQAGEAKAVLSPARQEISSLFLKGLWKSGVSELLCVVPCCMTQPVLSWLQTLPFEVNVVSQLHEAPRTRFRAGCFNVVLIDEAQLMAYYLAHVRLNTQVVEPGLPQHVFFPAVGGHLSEQWVAELYGALAGQAPMRQFLVCVVETVEEHWLIYKQKMAFLLQEEVEELLSAFKQDIISQPKQEKRGRPLNNPVEKAIAQQSPEEIYGRILGLIEERGFDGQFSAEHQPDYSSLGPEPATLEESVQKTHAISSDIHKSLCHFTHADLVLQAAWADVFDVSNFYLQGVAAEILGPVEPMCHISQQNQSLFDGPGFMLGRISQSDHFAVENATLGPFQAPAQEFLPQKSIRPKPYYGVQGFQQTQLTNSTNDWLNRTHYGGTLATDNGSEQLKRIFAKAGQVNYDNALRQVSLTDQKKKRARTIMAGVGPAGLSGRSGRFQILQYTEAQKVPERRATLCAKCNGGEAQRFGPQCDLCDEKMVEQLDIQQIETVERCGANHIQSFSELIVQTGQAGNSPKGAADFVLNNYLSSFSYDGGRRIDSLQVTPLSTVSQSAIEFGAQMLEKAEFASKKARVFAVLREMTTEASPMFYRIVRKRIDFDAPDAQKPNKRLWSQAQMQAVVQGKPGPVGFARLLQLAVPYGLFETFRVLSYNGVAYSQDALAAQFNASDFSGFASKYASQCIKSVPSRVLKAYLQYVVEHRAGKSVSELYSQRGSADFILQLFQTAVEAPELASTAVFNNGQTVNDSLLGWSIASGVASLAAFPAFVLSLQGYKQPKASHMPVFCLQRYYRHMVRNVCMCSPLYGILKDQESQKAFQAALDVELQQREKEAVLRRLLQFRWGCGQMLSGSFCDVAVGPCELDKGIAAEKEALEFYLHEPVGWEPPVLQSKQTQLPPMYQQQAQSQAAQKPPAYVGAHNQVQQPVATSSLSVPSVQQQVQAQQFTQPPVQAQLQAQPKPMPPKQKVVKEEPIQRQTIRPYFLDHVLTYFQADQPSKKPKDVAMRILNQYIPRNYQCKQNFLYVPDVTIAMDAGVLEVFPLQLGVKLDYKRRETLQRDTQSSFGEYLTQLCNSYAEHELTTTKMQVNPYKFWSLTKEAHQKIQDYVQNSKISLKQFAELPVACEWIFKRLLLLDCDVLHNRISYFQQDPAVGIPLDKPELYATTPERFVTAQQFKLCKTERNIHLDSAYNKIIAELNTYTQTDIKSAVTEIGHFGYGIGSSPTEVFTHYTKNFAVDKYPLLAKVAQLYAICRSTNKPYPKEYQVSGITDPQSLPSTLFQMENLRLMYIKITQIDYFIWLTRIQKIAKDKNEQESIDIIAYYYQQAICRPMFPDQQMDQQVVKKIDEIDAENRVIQSIDNIFCQFIPSGNANYNKQKQYPLPVFAINDMGHTEFRNAWVVSALYKLIFISLFGIRLQDVETVCQQRKDGKTVIAQIQQLYFEILNLWSRFHDYLLMFMQIDLGRPEDVYGVLQNPKSTASATQEKVMKKLQIIQPAKLIQDIQSVQNSTLLQLLQQQSSNVAPKSLKEFPPKSIQRSFSPLFEKIQVFAITDSSQQGVLESNINQFQLMSKDILIPNLPASSISPDLVISRLKTIVRALRYERAAVSDPEMHKQDEEMYIYDPRATPLTAIKTESETPKRSIQLPVAIPTTASLQPSVKKEKMSPPALPAQPLQQASEQEGLQLQLTEQNIDSIQKIPLNFYKQSEEMVRIFIRGIFGDALEAIVQKKKMTVEAFLFIQSSCQRQHSDEWGRLFSIMISMRPMDLKTSQQNAKEAQERLLAIAKGLGIKVPAQAVPQIDQETLQRMQQLLDTQQGKDARLLEAAVQYVQWNLEQAYFYAYQMREEVINDPNANVNQSKAFIHNALRQMQIMNQTPLNHLISGDDITNKKKMALATYFFLAQNAK